MLGGCAEAAGFFAAENASNDDKNGSSYVNRSGNSGGSDGEVVGRRSPDPGEVPTTPLVLDNIGVDFSDRYNRLGALDDLDKSIEHSTRAVSLTPDGHPDLSGRLSNLGLLYLTRFRRLGQLDDVEQAVAHTSLSERLSPTDRFDHLGTLGDLNESIEHAARAVSLTPDGHPRLSERLSNLGSSYRTRFLRLGQLDDIKQAIGHLSRALTLTPEGHSHMPSLLSNLGIVFSERFDRLGAPDDLDKSIEYKARAVSLTPDGHPDLPNRLAGLGGSYYTRFLRLEEPDALETAIRHISDAVTLTPDEHPNLSFTYQNLAFVNLTRYRRTDDPAHLHYSLECFRKGTLISAASPRNRFRCALDWAANAFDHNRTECMEAYRTAVDLLPQFIWIGATIHQRYDDLKTAANLANNAAHAALLYSNPTSALEWLEHARCVVWTQSLMLRTPLDQLHSSHPELADCLQAVSRQLQDAGSDLPGLQMLSADSGSQEQTGRDRRRLAQEYDGLLAEARTLPEFEDFLQPTKATGLMRAARYGPIVVINCHEQHCNVLAILPGQDAIKHLRLPDYNQQKARSDYSALSQSLRDKNIRQRGVGFKGGRKDGFASVLTELWRCVVKPVLDLLELTNGTPTDILPHITWCPTGTMAFLPLHAAGDYNQPRSCVFDYAISSYTPTLTALLASTPSDLARTSQVLAIGQANTPGKKPLPGTTGELDSLKSHAQGKVEYTQLVDSQATVTAVLDAMEGNDWVHLACHAHQNVNDPTKSGFFLHDGTLDLTAINRRSFSNKGLAFLSACQTATGDEALPDEAIHLASGMLMAGYRSVIATMWSVMDEDAPFVADRVYAELMSDGRVGNGEAGRALHDAVRLLREKVGVKEYGRWVPYIHIGS